MRAQIGGTVRVISADINAAAYRPVPPRTEAAWQEGAAPAGPRRAPAGQAGHEEQNR